MCMVLLLQWIRNGTELDPEIYTCTHIVPFQHTHNYIHIPTHNTHAHESLVMQELFVSSMAAKNEDDQELLTWLEVSFSYIAPDPSLFHSIVATFF